MKVEGDNKFKLPKASSVKYGLDYRNSISDNSLFAVTAAVFENNIDYLEELGITRVFALMLANSNKKDLNIPNFKFSLEIDNDTAATRMRRLFVDTTRFPVVSATGTSEESLKTLGFQLS